MSGIMQYFSFCLWFISLGLFSGFIHVTACVLSKTSVGLCHILLLCSLVSRHLGCFRLLDNAGSFLWMLLL